MKFEKGLDCVRVAMMIFGLAVLHSPQDPLSRSCCVGRVVHSNVGLLSGLSMFVDSPQQFAGGRQVRTCLGAVQKELR